MTSYMNPSKKVTDLLSTYLEFDPEQLKLGIWSGNLSLKDVNLREEAIYPHLNAILNRTDAEVQDRLKPPLRMRLIQGSIGELSMKIPWKSLVWGQDDVQVNVRNVVLTLALESREETSRRDGGDAFDFMDNEQKSEEKPVQFKREVKQRMIKEAEKRLMSGRNVTGWLRKTFKAEEEKRQKALLSREELVRNEGSVEKWLKGTTNDFFWRFYTGLQMKIENLKIVIVQDGIEVGVIIPSIQVLAGVSDKNNKNGGQVEKFENQTLDSNGTAPAEIVYESAYEDGEHVDKRIIFKGLGVYVRQAASPEKLLSRGNLIHVNDVTTNEFIIRPFDFEFSYSLFFPFPPEKRKKRKQAKAEAAKPVEEETRSVDGSETTTSTKRRRGKRDKIPIPKGEASVSLTETTAATSLQVSTPAKPPPLVREQTAASMTAVKRAVRRASIQQASFATPAPPAPATNDVTVSGGGQSVMAGTTATPALQQAPPTQRRHARRSSLAAPLMGSSTVAEKKITVSQLPPKQKIRRQDSAPLALPESVKQQYIASVEGDELTTRFDSRLHVSAIKVVFSTSQYHMLDLLLASGSRMRNGRPSQTIKAVTDDNIGIHRAISLLYKDSPRRASITGPRKGGSTVSMEMSVHSKGGAQARSSVTFPAEVGTAETIRKAVVRSWWQYAFGAVIWELRQRKRLKRMFQERFLSFNWDRQKHKRREYVELFVATNLAPAESSLSLSSSMHAEKAKLVSIEDELHVEQVLLYRAIARAVHVKGMATMPESILDVNIRQERRRQRREMQYSLSGSLSDDEHPFTRHSRESEYDQPWMNMPMMLSAAGKRLELTRRRLNSTHHEFLPRGEPFLKFYTMSRRRGVEESTVGMTIDTRATKSTRKGVRGTQESQTPNSSMKFSFTATLSKVEFLLIEDEKSNETRSDVSSVGGTDVSGLTDDERVWDGNMEEETTNRAEDISSAPILNSTDFLLFKEPETVLLQLVVSGTSCSALGRSGGSRKLNLKISSIHCTGYDSCKLLSVGSKLDDSAASIADIAVMGEPHYDLNASDETANALRFSLVLQDEERYIQCDSAHITTCMDLESISRISKFPLSTPALYPSNVLPRSGREEALLHVLNQNAAPNHFVFLDSSIRIKGIDIVFPEVHKASRRRKANDAHSHHHHDSSHHHHNRDHSWGSCAGSFRPSSKGKDGARLRVDLVEFYSGSAVASLRGQGDQRRKTKQKTRKLKMLDLEMFEESNYSLLSYDWIVAASGLDFEVMHVAVEGEEPTCTSFLDAPVQVEVFGTTNSGSIRDFTRPKREVIVETSPVDIKVSETRLERLSKVIPNEQALPAHRSVKSPCQPRLDVLSRSLLYVVDISVERFRVSLVTDEKGRVGMAVLSKFQQFEDFIGDFLNVVKDFDLGWPNGEALSGGMQICIDRLGGIGFGVEEGWQCANTALLNFLEDMTNAQNSTQDGESSDEAMLDAEDRVRMAVTKTAQVFADQLSEPIDHFDGVQHHLVFDMPSGLSVSCVKLYYDFHCMVNLPTIFVTNGEGIHILRLTPEVDAEEEEGMEGAEGGFTEEEDTRSDAFASKTSISSSPPAAAMVRMFNVDETELFGKGGKSLAILGEDASSDERVVESMMDIEIGDLELLFCQDVFDDLLETLSDFVAPLFACIPKRRSSNKLSNGQEDEIKKRFLCSTTAMSALFSSDGFVPFCRFNLNDCMWTSRHHEEGQPGSKLSAKSLAFLNLTSAGQLHPEPISVPPSALGLPLLITMENSRNYTDFRMDFRGVRINFLRQFLNECLQFFYYSDYGVGLFRSRMKEILEKANGTEASTAGRTHFSIYFYDCSIILPRHSDSSDMAAIEVEEASVVSSRQKNSFTMPTDQTDLVVGPLHADKFANPESEGDLSVSRTAIRITNFRIFTSIAESKPDDPDWVTTPESPAFGFFFGIDGRAEAQKPVYVKLASLGAQTAEDEAFWTNTEKAQRRWLEATANPVSLDIVVDYVPHMRLLIADPQGDRNNRVDLDVSLSQFCLLLTLWYGNMQQMPILFPHGPKEFERGARSLAVVSNFPFYGTTELKNMLSTIPGTVSETAIKFNHLSLSCRQDAPTKASASPITLAFNDATVHIISDKQGVTRLGAGSLGCSLVDESKCFKDVIKVERSGDRTFSYADTSFGILNDIRSLGVDHSLGFQLSILMGPEWAVYNLGMQCPDLVMSDFTTIFRFLDFVTVYFADESFGNPSFVAKKRVESIKEELMENTKASDKNEEPISVIDFRCWLRKPILKVPCDPNKVDSDFSVVESKEGLWYRFSGADTFSSQECVAQAMTLSFEDRTSMDTNASVPSALLIEGLSFGLRINYQGEGEHTDISLQIPYADDGACGLTAPGVFVDPYVVGKPMVCVPDKKPHRYMGPRVCEITCMVDVLPRAWTSLYGLFNADIQLDAESMSGVSSEEEDNSNDSEDESETGSDESSGHEDVPTMSFTGNVANVRLFVLDPVLGPHLPVTVVTVAETKITTSTFGNHTENSEEMKGQAPSDDLQVLVEANIWADYFKFGLTRSWEPLLEAYKFSVLFERSRYRGIGVTVSSDVPLHFNISGALLLILDECFDAFNSLIQEAMGDKRTKHERRVSNLIQTPVSVDENIGDLTIVHTRPLPLDENERVAFFLKNATGQMIRTFRIGGSATFTDEGKTVVNYLDNREAIKLPLLPSVSLVKNIGIVEVEYPGLENSPRSTWQKELGTSHQIDLQVPGFAWIRELKIDQFGRRFVDIVPHSHILKAKIKDDWRLANMMKLLVEVGLERGGREVAIRSLFYIQNMTTHALHIHLRPDANDDDVSVGEANDFHLEPGDSFAIPIVLLENALRLNGSQLGSFWLKPKMDTLDEIFTAENFHTKDLAVNLSTKPVQLAKVVSETATIFSEHKGNHNILSGATSGVTLSCPVMGSSDEREVAPFCYALEIARSPLMAARQQGTGRKGRREDQQHGPVAYTINVHAPLVLVNLLPERGRFEIMHAVRRTVLWFADLEPGQQVPVHSVGLDAPLLLFINLRFCCTPVGGGALIHHGTEALNENKDHLVGLKSFGKASKAVTKQLGKTLTSLGESPDKRGIQKIQQGRDAASVISRGVQTTAGPARLGLDKDEGNTVGGQTYRVDTAVFLPSDCASETVVVDRVGQRLSLQLENILGGGGQRRISVFAPFWIVNSTEHALRYKQEGLNTFVSGTVLSREKDGSVPIDGGKAGWIDVNRNQNEVVQPLNQGTIFAGTAGALATSVGRCSLSPEDVAAVVDKNMPLERLAKLAFMFNFHEGSLTMGGQKLCIQLYDGTGQSKYQSDWSRGFSLGSVGFSQVVEMPCGEGRALEVSVVVQTAPGHLSGYTKIVRILPRFIAVNDLSCPIRLWQDNSSFRPPSAETVVDPANQGSAKWRFVQNKVRSDQRKVNQYESLWGRQVNISIDEQDGRAPIGTAARETAMYIASVPASAWRPFNLPDSRGDRQVRVGEGVSWNLTSSISTDVPGEHTLRVSRSTDIRLLKHVSTRASAQYSVNLPPTGEASFDDELGIWFETEWGSNRSLLVKAVKKGSYCFNKTDVRVGDELLLIDGAPVSRMSFADAMGILRSRLAEIKSPPSLENQSQQRRLGNRRAGSLRFGKLPRGESQHESKHESTSDCLIEVRPLTLTFRTAEERLRKVRRKAARSQPNPTNSTRNGQHGSGHAEEPSLDFKFLKLELRAFHNIMFLLLRDSASAPYEIQNRSKKSTIYFRQKGCSAHPWRSLKPGASEVYTWEEPLKPKRLSLRVATASAFDFVTADASDCSSRAMSESESSPLVLKQITKRTTNGKVRDEEDAVFSPSVNIRLDEIGYRDMLRYQVDPSLGSKRTLEMEVGVIGSTRVLVVQDASKNEGEDLLQLHLDALHEKADDEEKRLAELRSMARLSKQQSRKSSNESSQELIEGSKLLMYDFPEERTLSGRHQLVVEVLEAVGLSADTYLGVCNPYVEVSLSTNATGRRSLFKKNPGVRRTYFVRKTLNPTWNGQSFIFDVPPEAVTVTRGHSLKIKVRNFRKVGLDVTLGRAEVDLNSVRNQKPLTGWFPLAGRTGRRELENSASHWGRGSIRLKVHWIYTTSALFDYYVMLSETRLAELKESIEGMSLQLERKREEDKKLLDRIDGFRAVRLNASPTKKPRSGDIHEARDNAVMRILDPVLSRAKKSLAMVSEALPSVQPSAPASKKRLPPALAYGGAHLANTEAMSPTSAGELESLIVQKRHALQGGLLSQMMEKRRELELRNYVSSGNFPVTSFKSWTEAQTLMNDKDFEVSVDGDSVQVRLKPCHRRKELAHKFSGDTPEQRIECIAVPAVLSPSAFMRSMEYASKFNESRRYFERSARCALRVALNPGGWLTIRPIQAKNLPDSSWGMSVKVQYDSKSQSSETVDSTVFPTWFRGSSSVPGSPKADAMEYLSGDLHFYIPPQQTNGFLRLSVNAEVRHQGIVTKTEVGVLHIPLGGAIAACVNAVEEYLANPRDAAEPPIYIRWFPLNKPRDEIPVEGDQRSGRRAVEAEKREADQFSEYFTPCIQLGLIWSPEVARETNDGEDGPDGVNQHLRPGGVFSSQVQRYFNADINQISLALIDSDRPTELLSCTLTDVDVRHWVTKAKSRYGVAVGWFQFDQQNQSARDPVVLAPTQKGVLTPVLQMLAVKDNMRSKTDVLSFDFIDVSLSEFDLSIEEKFLFQVYDFFTSLRLREKTKQKWQGSAGQKTTAGYHLLAEDSCDEPSLLSVVVEVTSNEQADRRVYIQQLSLGVLKFNISYLKGKKESKISYDLSEWTNGQSQDQISSSELAESDAFRRWSQNTSHDEFDFVGKGGSSLPSLIASLFPNISDAPVRLQAKSLNHVFYSPDEILLYIKGFYQTEILRQIYKIIGSLDFVGNPTMVLNSVVSGLRDLIVMPSVALMRSPTDPSRVGLGVAKGTLSLFSHSTSGFFGFASKVSAAAGQGLATLSLDKEYRSWHREQIVSEATNLNRSWKRRGVQKVGKMIVRPVTDIVYGVTSGVLGLLVSPVTGFKKAGGKGMALGVATGVVGVIVKPTVGVLDALSHFTGSIHDIAKSVNVLEKRVQPTIRYRLPYVFGINKILTPYEDEKARATDLLADFPPKKRRGTKIPTEVVIHVEVLPNLGVATYGIVTNLRLLLLRVKKEQSGSLSSSFCWQVSLAGESTISSEVTEHGHNGVALTINVKKPPKMNETETIMDEPGAMSVSLDDALGFESSEISEAGDQLEHGHGTSRSKEGELLEWFTVVAEYQHRRQLCRLHNAVSCVSGNFKSIIRDKPLGRFGSTEGYSSFGVFHFEERDLDRENQLNTAATLQLAFDSLPWCNSEKFTTEGPQWLRRAQSIAFEAMDESDWAALSSFEPDPVVPATNDGKKTARRLTRWLVGRLPTIPDSEHEAHTYETPLKFVTTTAPQSPGRDVPAQTSNELAEDDSPRQVPMKTDGNGNEVHLSTASSSVDTNSSDFVSCRSGDSDDNHVPFEEQETRKKRTLRRRLRRRVSEGDPQPTTQGSPSPIQPSKLVEDVDLLDEDTEDELPDGRTRLSSRRVERMESLMEQLMIFSSEQALSSVRSTWSVPRATQAEDAKPLWDEIQQLRSQLQRQSKQEEQSKDEIENLRAELADLRHQVMTGSVSASGHSSEAAGTTGTTGNNDSSKRVNENDEIIVEEKEEEKDFDDCLTE